MSNTNISFFHYGLECVTHFENERRALDERAERLIEGDSRIDDDSIIRVADEFGRLLSTVDLVNKLLFTMATPNREYSGDVSEKVIRLETPNWYKTVALAIESSTQQEESPYNETTHESTQQQEEPSYNETTHESTQQQEEPFHNETTHESTQQEEEPSHDETTHESTQQEEEPPYNETTHESTQQEEEPFHNETTHETMQQEEEPSHDETTHETMQQGVDVVGHHKKEFTPENASALDDFNTIKVNPRTGRLSKKQAFDPIAAMIADAVDQYDMSGSTEDDAAEDDVAVQNEDDGDKLITGDAEDAEDEPYPEEPEVKGSIGGRTLVGNADRGYDD